MNKMRVSHMLGDARTRVDLREKRVTYSKHQVDPLQYGSTENYIEKFSEQVDFIKQAVSQYLGLKDTSEH